MASKIKSSVSTAKIGSNPKTGNKNSTEPLKCTGKFKDDFENLCQMKNIKFYPEVVSRSKRPGSAIQSIYLNQQQQSLESSLAKDKKSGVNDKNKRTLVAPSSANFDADHEIEQNPEFIDLPPKSFILKDSEEFFRPKIHVEMDNPDKLDTVTEVHIKGWKLDKSLIEILNLCLPSIDQLNTLNLWNAGLDEESVRLISSMLPNCSNLKTLILDNNPIKIPIYHVLLYEENSNVQNLSLRNNSLDDDAIQCISNGLGELKRSNTKLLTLNLNCNLISNNGAISLAKALRTNRTLLVLNLANNNIGDIGAKALADVISKFALTFDEIIHRRYVISGRTFERSASPSSRKGNSDYQNRPNSQKGLHSNLNDTKLKKDKDKQGKKSTELAAPGSTNNANTSNNQTTGTVKNPKETLAKTKKDDKPGRKASVNDTKLKNSIKPLLNKTGKRNKEFDEFNDDFGNRHSAKLKNAALLEISPLTDMAEYVDDNLYLFGNRSLLSLNLSKNELTEKSLNHFLLALQYQKTLMDIHKGQGTGLLRLVINRNYFSNDNDVYIKLNEFMKQRDPFYKPPNSNLGDSESVQSGKDSSLGRNAKSGGKH